MLFGVSYGTKVALDYAAEYPANVESLVLDSVVPPEGPDPSTSRRFKAMPRVAGRAVRRRRLPRRHAERRPRPRNLAAQGCGASRSAARSIDARRPRADGARSTRTALLDILLAGDLNPTLRAELPGAMRSALRGDTRAAAAPAAARRGPDRDPRRTRAGRRSTTPTPSAVRSPRAARSRAFPWDRNAAATQRAEPGGARRQRPSGADYRPVQLPGGARAASRSRSASPGPTRARPAAPPAALPPVPDADPRRRLRPAHAAARTPRASPRGSPARSSSRCRSPATRSSASDLSDCAKNAIAALLRGHVAAQCPDAKPGPRADARAPTRAQPRCAGGPGASRRSPPSRRPCATSSCSSSATRSPPGAATPVGAKVAGLRAGHATATSRGLQPAPRRVRPGRRRQRHRPDPDGQPSSRSAAARRLTAR